MRRRLFLVLLLACGCGPKEPETVGRVELPKGVERPANLQPDPPRPKIAPGDPSVAGVCRVSETEVACWDMAGKPDSKLTGQAKAGLASRQATYSLTVGKRFRLVALELPGDEETAYEVSADPVPGQGRAVTTTNGTGRQWLGLSLDPGTKTTGVDFLRKQRMPGEASLELRKGATVSLGGGKLSVASIEPIKPEDPMSFLLRGKPGWKIVARRADGPDSLAYEPIDPYPMVTGKGQRANMDPKTGRMRIAPAGYPRVQSVSGSEAPEGGFLALIDIDPVKARSIPVQALRQTRSIVPAVPLDPQSR